MSPKSRYLVTGGLGVIGSRFVDVVARAGHGVTVLDSAEEPRNIWTADRLSKDYGDLIRIMVRRVETMDFEPLIRSHDFILHAAAHTGIPHSEQDPSDDWTSNVDATRVILEALRKSSSPIPTVMLSSVKPYRVGSVPWVPHGERVLWTDPEFANGVDEDCVLEPDEPYAASKMAQSALVMAYGRTYGLPVTVLRCSNLYGDAPCHGPRHGWLTWFCISAALGWPIELQGIGIQTRDMLFSDDVASAVLASFDKMSVMGGKVFNIGGGAPNAISCKEAVSILSSVLGKNPEVVTGPGRKNEDMCFVTDDRRFTTTTGWEPSVGVRTGIERIVRWASDHADDLKRLYGR